MKTPSPAVKNLTSPETGEKVPAKKGDGRGKLTRKRGLSNLSTPETKVKAPSPAKASPAKVVQGKRLPKARPPLKRLRSKQAAQVTAALNRASTSDQTSTPDLKSLKHPPAEKEEDKTEEEAKEKKKAKKEKKKKKAKKQEEEDQQRLEEQKEEAVRSFRNKRARFYRSLKSFGLRPDCLRACVWSGPSFRLHIVCAEICNVRSKKSHIYYVTRCAARGIKAMSVAVKETLHSAVCAPIFSPAICTAGASALK